MMHGTTNIKLHILTHPLLATRSWKSRAIPLPTLWATTGPVTGLSPFITYSECVSLASVIQHAVSMRHIMLTPVACLALLYIFPLFSHKRHGFRKNKVIIIIMIMFMKV